MPRLGILPVLWGLVRSHLVAAALVAALAAAFVEVYTTGTGPVPQAPPEGLLVERGRATLQWNRGTRPGPMTLQISLDDPDFAEPILERKVNGTSHTLNDLEPGRVYYWRLVHEGEASPAASFEVSKYDVDI